MHVLVIGSSLIDLFIDLDQNPQISLENEKIILNLGDKIPVGVKALSLGGNGGNTAAGIKKLGIDVSLYTYLGSDALSNYIASTMQDEGVEVIIEKKEGKTTSLSIILSMGKDRTILSHHNKGNHSFDSSKITKKPDLIYLTSIGNEWEEAYKNVLVYAKENNIPIALSPGSAQMNDLNETLLQSIHVAKMLFCNLEEAKKICEKLSGNTIDDPKNLLTKITDYGFELISVTDGENGAYALNDKNKSVYKIEAKQVDVNEKTGAGDAYAAAFLASYLNNLSIEECMKRGVLNALEVISSIGAHTGQLRSEEMDQKSKETDLQAQKI